MHDETENMKYEHEKYKKEETTKYTSLLNEKERVVSEMIKQQKENELTVAKLQAELEKVQMELTLKSFRFERQTIIMRRNQLLQTI